MDLSRINDFDLCCYAFHHRHREEQKTL